MSICTAIDSESNVKTKYVRWKRGRPFSGEKLKIRRVESRRDLRGSQAFRPSVNLLESDPQIGFGAFNHKPVRRFVKPKSPLHGTKWSERRELSAAPTGRDGAHVGNKSEIDGR
ncbi:hypothetical protein RUM43_003056 [Polyplax serrata]|uniref:Uncharacterized protein n=1 Tax=Polyplax serrata TaxID=468196 RepID=A0AAN8NZK3_POLSC